MIIKEIHRLIAYDMMLVICLIVAGYTIALKIYSLSFMFIVIAFLSHARLTRILEIKEKEPLENTAIP